MENNQNGDRDQTNRDAQNAEEFTESNPNRKDDFDSQTPQYTDHENKRLDTDPNRYNNFVNTSDSDNANGYQTPKDTEAATAHENENSHYSSEDDRIPHLTHENRNDEADHSQDEIRPTDKDEEQFFEGI